MTNPALDALERLTNYNPHGGSYAQQKADIEAIRTALANAPEVVTPQQFDDIVEIYSTKEIISMYPNGLKITAAPNGGG